MKKTILLFSLGVLSPAVAAFADMPAADAKAGLLARGRYLVENVGTCADWHTPHNQGGSPDLSRSLLGAPLAFQPTVPIPEWAPVAPPIAGLPGYTDAQARRVLQTGINTAGQPLHPPMPGFRLNAEDAGAVVAYLRSLGIRSR